MAAAKCARDAAVLEMKRKAFGWQYWARTFGYSANTLLTNQAGMRWLVEQERLGPPVDACSDPPSERMFQDPVTRIVYDADKFHASWLSIPAHVEPSQIRELQTASLTAPIENLVFGTLCITHVRPFVRPQSVVPLARATRKSLGPRSYDPTAKREVCGQ